MRPSSSYTRPLIGIKQIKWNISSPLDAEVVKFDVRELDADEGKLKELKEVDEVREDDATEEDDA